jgi:hypothetical protein
LSTTNARQAEEEAILPKSQAPAAGAKTFLHLVLERLTIKVDCQDQKQVAAAWK